MVMEKYIKSQLSREEGLIEVLFFKRLHIVYQWQTNTICHSAYNSKYGGKNLDELITQGKVRVTVFSVN